MVPVVLLFAVFIAEMCRYRKPGGATANIAGSFLALLYVGVMLTCAVSFRIAYGIGALASWIIVVKMGDTGAYFVGRLIGRHKLAPAISPGKTMEGAVGDLVFDTLYCHDPVIAHADGPGRRQTRRARKQTGR